MTTQGLASGGRARGRKEAADSLLGRDFVGSTVKGYPQGPASFRVESTLRARKTSSGKYVRALRFARAHPGAPYSSAKRPPTERTSSKAQMGRNHGSTPSQDPDHLPNMSQRHSCRSGRWTPPSGMKTLESRVSGNSQARFGGGQGEKGRLIGTSPAAYPTTISAVSSRNYLLLLAMPSPEVKH